MKRHKKGRSLKLALVAPRAGAWIETDNKKEVLPMLGRRPSCGGVD